MPLFKVLKGMQTIGVSPTSHAIGRRWSQTFVFPTWGVKGGFPTARKGAAGFLCGDFSYNAKVLVLEAVDGIILSQPQSYVHDHEIGPTCLFWLQRAVPTQGL